MLVEIMSWYISGVRNAIPFVFSETYTILFIYLFNLSTAGKIKEILECDFLESCFGLPSFAAANFNILLQAFPHSKAVSFSCPIT